MRISAQWDDIHQNNTGSFMSTGGGICTGLMRMEISRNLMLHAPFSNRSMARSAPRPQDSHHCTTRLYPSAADFVLVVKTFNFGKVTSCPLPLLSKLCVVPTGTGVRSRDNGKGPRNRPEGPYGR
jgi:hypothetical protein